MPQGFPTGWITSDPEAMGSQESGPFIRTYRRVQPITVVESEKSVKIASQTRANVVATGVAKRIAKTRREFMTRILLLGLDPETVDFLTLHCRQA